MAAVPGTRGLQQSVLEIELDAEVKTESVKILLADDNPIFATGCALTLAGYGIEVVGEGYSPADVLVKYDALRPDVVVIDAAFGGRQYGLDLARDLLAAYREAKVVVLSQHDHDNLYREAYRLGALAFITKNRDPADLADAVYKAKTGSLYFLPHVAEHLANIKVRGDDAPQDRLQGRELDIFKMMAMGRTNLEIAENLRLSAKSVSNYSQAIKEKLGIHRAAELTRLAVRHGMIEP